MSAIRMSMVIANGLHLNPITEIIKKNNCTWFLPKSI